ncbi:hypothetical protein BDY21DRAFT_337544 [Lineolata rhizophorae]|uniref:Uncharacterized protein n=1 Tax=Lineolata rhizophorae TaxID=578093 RepID=A0A6A6P873_9PEZI|nr:hypothetical protein BDY21DRAFT_337544 [Lineolata rhizophorae]
MFRTSLGASRSLPVLRLRVVRIVSLASNGVLECAGCGSTGARLQSKHIRSYHSCMKICTPGMRMAYLWGGSWLYKSSSFLLLRSTIAFWVTGYSIWTDANLENLLVASRNRVDPISELQDCRMLGSDGVLITGSGLIVPWIFRAPGPFALPVSK